MKFQKGPVAHAAGGAQFFLSFSHFFLIRSKDLQIYFVLLHASIAKGAVNGVRLATMRQESLSAGWRCDFRG